MTDYDSPWFCAKAGAACVALIVWAGVAAAAPDPADDPALATFGNSALTLRHLEEFARELPSAQRVPVARDAGRWRETICREYAKNVVLTKKALEEKRHEDSGYLRSRDYFAQEYFSYALLRDEVVNKIDVSPAALETLYQRRLQDYYSSASATLRLIRLRTEQDAATAAARLAGGEAFEAVEAEMSQASPRYKNRVLGPFPAPADRASIPPPAAVIAAALETEAGKTTGPLEANGFWFLVRTESKTGGRQRSLEETAVEVEKRMRQGMGDQLTRQLMARLKSELKVEVDENAPGDPSTGLDDTIATVGRLRVPFREYSDLHGQVRGPALTAAQTQTGKVAQFVTPLILAEAAWARGYSERDEFRRASWYYDLQQLGGRYLGFLAEQRLREPTEGEMRAKYRQEAQHKRTSSAPRPAYEAMKADIRALIQQHERPATEAAVMDECLAAAGFRMESHPKCSRLTAIEALAAAAGKLPPGAKPVEMTGIRGDDPLEKPSKRPGEPVVPLTPALSGAGRHTAWRLSYTTGDAPPPAARDGATSGTSESVLSEIIIEEAGYLNDGSGHFTSNTLAAPWADLLRYDSDALARAALDDGLSDFAAKHGEKIAIGTSIQFQYEGRAPADCIVRFSGTPADAAAREILDLRYDAKTGERTTRRLGEAAAPCPTCPGPDGPVS